MRPWLWLDHWLCGLKGHPGAMRRCEDGRMWVACWQCGWASSGVQVTSPAISQARRVIPFLNLTQARGRRRKCA